MKPNIERLVRAAEVQRAEAKKKQERAEKLHHRHSRQLEPFSELAKRNRDLDLGLAAFIICLQKLDRSSKEIIISLAM